MGNLEKPLNFPFVWARKGPRNLGVVYFIVPRGLLAERGTLNQGSESTACRVARSFWCIERGRLFCAKRLHTWLEPHIWRPEAHMSDYCGEPTRWDTLKPGDLGSRPGVSWGGGVDLVMN